MINKKALITKNVNFNLQQQFVSKYTTTTLVKTSYGDEHTLFFKKEKAQLLDLYLQNYINNSDQNYYLINHNFTNDSGLNNIYCRKFDEIIDKHIIKLPKAKPQAKIRLVDAFVNKKKIKLPTKVKTISLKTLSSILNFAFQANKNNHRSYSSVDGLYPISLYLYVINVEGLTPGFYQYQPFHQSLKPINMEQVVDINRFAVFSQSSNSLNSVILFYVYNSYVNRFKFANQSLLLASFEIGMMMQNLQLLSYEFNFSLCHSTLFHPDVILKKLKIADYYGQYLLNVTMVGLHNNE